MRSKIFILFISTCIFIVGCKGNNNSENRKSGDELINDPSLEVTEEGQNPEEGKDVLENSENFNSVVEQHGQLSISGNKIINKEGNPVQLRGMSLFWSQWIGKYYSQETIKWLKEDWQCTVVRAAMAVEAPDGYLVNPDVEKQKIMTVIDAAIEEGMYVIVDWHSHHAEKYLPEAKAFFSELAQKYGDYPHIIYEPYNEPLDVSWNEVLKPYHEEIIKAIREHDPDNLIICGTRSWSQRVDEVVGNKIDDPNVAYTLHYYAATHKQPLRDIAKTALNGDVPIFVTEYGVSEASGDVSINEGEANVWWDFLDEHNISWCNWSVADKEELSAALKPGASTQGGWKESELTQSGVMVRNELKENNPKY